MMKKIGIVSAFDPYTDRKAHSGILYKINEAIREAGLETIWVKNPFPFWYRWICRLIALLNRFGILKGVYFDRTFLGAKLLASTIDYSAINKCDYIMVIHYFHVPAFGKINKPIIYHSDATFELANNYYLHNMPKWNQKQAERIERMALAHSSWHLSSSKWRENSLIEHYGVDKDKCVVLEYGSCVDTNGIKRTPVNDGVLRLLFMGVDWSRKGGAIAVEAANILNQRGINTLLTVAGLKVAPQECLGKNYVRFVGFLDKNIPARYEQMKSILKTTDIFLLPTRAECSGVVFCEAADYGIPVVTYDTGGVGSYVINGLNGSRLPKGAEASAFADEIQKIWQTTGLLDNLSKGAQQLSEEKLNWHNWTDWFKENIL